MEYRLMSPFRGLIKENFLKEMSELWDGLEEIGIDRIIGFKAYAGKPIEVKITMAKK